MTDANTINHHQQTAEAADAGTEIASEWRGGVQALVRVCVGLRKGMLAFQHDRTLLDAFLSPLVGCGFLTASDALLGRSCSKISMLMQIAEHEAVVTRPEITRHLSDGFTVVYQAIVIFRRLPGGEAEKIEQLAGILLECPQDGAREHLLGVTRKMRRAAENTPAQAAKASKHGPAARMTLGTLLEARSHFDLVVVTPDDALPLLKADYPDDAEETVLEHCLPVHRLIGENSAAVIVTTTDALAVVEERLLPLCGFGRPTRFILQDHPAPRDVTRANMILVAKRGKPQIVDLPAAVLNRAGSIEPITFASELFPSAQHKLHLFAQGETPGWTNVIGSDSWLEMPSVR